MASPLSGSLATVIYKAFKALFLDATLSRDTLTPGSPDVSFDPPSPNTATYACKAMVQDYSEHDRLAGLVAQSDRRILILAGSLTVTPTNQDRITIQNQTYVISEVSTDPALAVWTCKAGI
jgi:hypothetical protein